ncbi:uncharacterized protein ACIB01_010898 isoform 1-T2 [Guaruba guarouba]
MAAQWVPARCHGVQARPPGTPRCSPAPPPLVPLLPSRPDAEPQLQPRSLSRSPRSPALHGFPPRNLGEAKILGGTDPAPFASFHGGVCAEAKGRARGRQRRRPVSARPGSRRQETSGAFLPPAVS